MALPKVVPPGSVSVTLTLVAVLGPLFVTVRVYVNVAPAVTGSGESVFVIERSDEAVTVVLSLSLLLPGTGSLTLEATVALLVIVPPALGAVTIIVMTGAAPTPRLARVQVTTPLT